MMLDPELKAKWLAALRSGQYPQIRGALHTSEGYCCLGVLCEQLPDWRWTLVELGTPTTYGYHAPNGTPEGMACRVSLTPMERRMGLSWKAQQRLMDMNDQGAPFAAIADWIEANL